MELLKIVGCFLRRVNVKGLHYERIINSKDNCFSYFSLNKNQNNFKYSLKEFLEIKKANMEYFKKNKDAFDSFYDEAKDDIKEINRLILK